MHFKKIEIRWQVGSEARWIQISLDFISRRLYPDFDPETEKTERLQLAKKIKQKNIPYSVKRMIKMMPKSSKV